MPAFGEIISPAAAAVSSSSSGVQQQRSNRHKMRDSFSFSSSRKSNKFKEDEVLSSIRSMAASSSSKPSRASGDKSKASRSSKRTRKSTIDMRDDYDGGVSRRTISDEREEHDVPRDLVITSKTSNSTGSRKTKSSHSKSSKRSRDDLEYWSALSVRAAMSVLKAGGSEKIANEVSNVVLATGKKQDGKQKDSKTLMFLSTKLALIVLEAGGEEKVASAVSSAVMASEEDDIGVVQVRVSSRGKEVDAPSVTESMASRRRQLKAKEKEMEEKRKALEQAERRNKQREDEINKKIAAQKRKQYSNASHNAEAESVTSSIAARRRALKAKQLEMEEKKRELKALEDADRRRMQRAKEIEEEEKRRAYMEAVRKRNLRMKEINDKKLREEEEIKALEEQLNERKREIMMKEEDRVERMNMALTEKELDSCAGLILAQRQKIKEKEDEIQLKFKMLELNKLKVTEQELEIKNKLEAIRVAEEERLVKEREMEEKARAFAKKEQYINERQALIDAASVARRKKEKMVDEKVLDFEIKEKEINRRLAAIEEASVSRRRREKDIEDRIKRLAQREQQIDDKLDSIENSSVISRQKRHVKERERELEMEERLRLIELNKKEQLIAEKNKALEEAMQLNIQRENEIQERMKALDAATSALLQKAIATPEIPDEIPHDDSVETDLESFRKIMEAEEDWCTENKHSENIKPKDEGERLGFFSKMNKAFEDTVFGKFSCSGSVSEDYMPKDVYFGGGTSAEASELSGGSGCVANKNLFPWERNLPTIPQEDSYASEESPEPPLRPRSKQISNSLNEALKASVKMYSPSQKQQPLKSSLKKNQMKPSVKIDEEPLHFRSASPGRNKVRSVSPIRNRGNTTTNKSGGLKNKFRSVLRKPKQRSKSGVCHEL